MSAPNPTPDEIEARETELFRSGPLSVLTASVKSNSQVRLLLLLETGERRHQCDDGFCFSIQLLSSRSRSHIYRPLEKNRSSSTFATTTSFWRASR